MFEQTRRLAGHTTGELAGWLAPDKAGAPLARPLSEARSAARWTPLIGPIWRQPAAS